jgi:threonine aldolase
MDRRHFLASTGLAAASTLATPIMAGAASAGPETASLQVNFSTEGLGLTPAEYAAQLQVVAAAGPLVPDNYSLGGAIEAMEQQFAAMLGKPAAMFLPTGTLANLVAVRTLAGGGDKRVLVQAESHLYNDSGDGAQSLAGLNLVPLAEGETGFTLEAVQRWLQRSNGGRVRTPVGVISIESPVRRRDHACFDPAEMARISAWARAQDIRLHLDGARLFNLPHHTGQSLPEITALFDTVYVSLWKHFNGTAGAILAGEKAFIEGLYHVRRMFGGALPQAWPQVALVPGHAATYLGDYAAAWRRADEVIARLEADGRYRARKLPDGSSRFFLAPVGGARDAIAFRARAQGVRLPLAPPDATEFTLQVNPTLLRRPAEEIAAVLLDAHAA